MDRAGEVSDAMWSVTQVSLEESSKEILKIGSGTCESCLPYGDQKRVELQGFGRKFTQEFWARGAGAGKRWVFLLEPERMGFYRHLWDWVCGL